MKGLSNGARIAAVAARPVAVGDHGDGRRPWRIVIARQQTSDDGFHAERFVICPSDKGSGRVFDRIGSAGVERDGAEPGKPGEDFGVFRQRAHQRIREILHGLGATLRHGQLHQSLRIADGERTQEHGIDQAEDGRVRADAEGQRQHRGYRECGASAHAAQRVAKVLRHAAGPSEGAPFAILFLGLLHATEAAQRGAPCLAGAHAGALIVFGLHFDMKAKFIVELTIETPLGKQAA